MKPSRRTRRSFAALKLVHGPDLNAGGQCLAKATHLHVVRRDHENVALGERPDLAVDSRERATSKQAANRGGDGVRLFDGRLRVADVLDGHEPQAGSVEHRRCDPLTVSSFGAPETAVVRQLRR